MKTNFKIVDYQEQLAPQIVTIWMQSKEEALGNYHEPHDFNGFLNFLKENLSVSHIIKIAIDLTCDKVIGFIAYDKGHLDQLYIDSKYQGKGLGSILLQFAKDYSQKGLELYTFQCNKPAQAFYEKHGFTVVKYGTENEENLPDILYSWSK